MREERERERENRTTRFKKLVFNTRLNFNVASSVKRAIFDLIRELRSISGLGGGRRTVRNRIKWLAIIRIRRGTGITR